MSYYHAYAPFYDGSGQFRFAVLMGQYLNEVLARHPVAGRRALDLACGTGTLALMLAEQGWHVLGLDRSAAMLDQARAKAANLDVAGQISFVQGDMRRLEMSPAAAVDAAPRSLALLAAFDLVTCVYDSLNYVLDERDLASCFNGVGRALAPGGMFVADMNTRHFLEHDWGSCEVLEQPGFVQVTQSYFDPASACSTMVLTGFAGNDEDGYMRFDETHIERAYTPALVEQLLRAAGLAIEARYDCFTFQPIAERTQRIAWIARKPEMSSEA